MCGHTIRQMQIGRQGWAPRITGKGQAAEWQTWRCRRHHRVAFRSQWRLFLGAPFDLNFHSVQMKVVSRCAGLCNTIYTATFTFHTYTWYTVL